MNEVLPPPPPDVKRLNSADTAQALGTPMNFRSLGRQRDQAVDGGGDQAASEGAQSQPATAKKQATETLAQRAGALSDEIDFPDFVSSLIHGTFDAIVDTSIRQMEAYAHLVSAVSKSVEQFTDDNVTLNQARDWLVQQFPQDLYLDLSGPPKVLPKPLEGEDADQARSPEWLREFQLEGEDLTAELIEEQLVPKARSRVGQGRQQMLATMVLLGLNRVVVRDGSISANLRFRATAADKSKVEYAVSDDPQGETSWGSRGSAGHSLPSTKVSTVGVNVQSDSGLAAELTGQVKINFASETLPLDRFMDEAKRTLVERRAKPGQVGTQSARPAGTDTVAPATPIVAAPVAATPAPAAPGAPPNPPAAGATTPRA